MQLKAAGTQSERIEAPTPTYTAKLCDLSPEGACIELARAMVLRRRDWVVFSIKIENKTLEIPARVAWSSNEHARQRVGVKLRLELAPLAVRARYARWIVGRVQASLNPGI